MVNEIIKANKDLVKYDLVGPILHFNRSKKQIPIEDDELLEVLENKRVTAYFKGRITSPNQIKLIVVSDEIPTNGLLLIRSNHKDVSYDELTMIFKRIVEYQGGLNMAMSLVFDDLLKDDEKELIILATK